MFLEGQIRTLEALYIGKSEAKSQSTSKFSEATRRSARSQFAQRQGSRKTCCSLCHGEHYVLFCEDFKRKDSKAKKKFAVTNRTPVKIIRDNRSAIVVQWNLFKYCAASSL